MHDQPCYSGSVAAGDPQQAPQDYDVETEIEERTQSTPRIGSRRFKAQPELNRYFEKVEYEGKSGRSKGDRCRSCGFLIKAHQPERAIKHIRDCPAFDAHDRSDFSTFDQDGPKSAVLTKGLNFRSAKVSIKSNVTFSIVEDGDFRRIFRDLCPSFKLTTSDRMINHYVRRLSDKTETKIRSQVCEQPL